MASSEPWRNRIISYGEEDPEQLLANEANWRIHPKPQQDALGGVLSDIGVVQNIIVNKRSSPEWGRDQGVETLIDGHLRVSLALSTGQPSIPITYVDLDPVEEALILATLDPIGAMAATDAPKLDELLREVKSGDAAVQGMLESLAAKAGLIPPNDPNAEWQGMPEFQHEDLSAFKSITMHFNSQGDVDAFAQLVGQTITDKTKSIWFPKRQYEPLKALSYHADA